MPCRPGHRTWRFAATSSTPSGGSTPTLRTSEDWDLWLRLAATGLPACVPRAVVALRTHAGMASRAVDRMLADIEVIAKRHSIPIDRARHQRWAAWMCLEDGRRGAAVRHYMLRGGARRPYVSGPGGRRAGARRIGSPQSFAA